MPHPAAYAAIGLKSGADKACLVAAFEDDGAGAVAPKEAAGIVPVCQAVDHVDADQQHFAASLSITCGLPNAVNRAVNSALLTRCSGK